MSNPKSDETTAKRPKHDEMKDVKQDVKTVLQFKDAKFKISTKLFAEIGKLQHFASHPVKGSTRVIQLKEEEIDDENFTEHGFTTCMNILLETCEENCGPDKLVSVLAVASYLEIKDLILSTGDLMKDNIDETNCISFYNACKQYSLKMVLNEIFHWFLINFMCLFAEDKIIDSQFDLMGKEFVKNLIEHPSLVVSEDKLYDFVKKYMIADLKKQSLLEQYEKQEDAGGFLSTVHGAKYQELFDHLRINNLLAYPAKPQQLYRDKIFSPKILNERLFKFHLNLLEMRVPPTDDLFRFVKRISSAGEFEFTNDFFVAGISLKFMFSPGRISVLRLPLANPPTVSNLMNYGPVTVNVKFTLYAPPTNGRCKNEATATCEYELYVGKEKLIHRWQRNLKSPSNSCILFGEVKIYTSSPIIVIN